MMQISFYVPREHAEKVKSAMFKVGGGKIGNYDCCSFEIEGIGQFRPLAGSQPFVGKVSELKIIPELKVEMVCDDADVLNVIAALKSSHPYETPAYYVTKTLGI